MPTGLGVPHDANGNGTTTDDLQRIIAAEYSNAGIIDGARVSGTATMSYSVSAGAVLMDTGTDMAVKVPVPATTVPTDPAPATGSRTDTLFVVQHWPGVDGDSLAFVARSPSTEFPTVPAGAIVLDARTVPAGATSTSGTTSIHNRKFARPVGGSLGRLHLFVDQDTTPRLTTTVTRGAGSFYLPTDRDIEFNMTSTVAAVSSNGQVADERGSVLYQFHVDGKVVRSWERGYDRVWESKQLSFLLALEEGRHDVHYTVRRQWVETGATSGRWAVRYGGAEQYVGDAFRVYDRGVIAW